MESDVALTEAEVEARGVVSGGPGISLDTEMLDVTMEIPTLGVPDDIRSERDLVKRRERYMDWIERRIDSGVRPPVSATSVAVEDEEWKVLTLMISARQELTEGKILPAQRVLTQDLRVELATWSGLQLSDKRTFRSGGAHMGGVKVGMRPFNGADAQAWERRGGTINIYRDYPAQFDVGLVEGRRLLDLYGWRVSAHRNRWWLYEIRGPLERELALWLGEQAHLTQNADLLARAKIICPTAFDDEPAEKGRRR